MYDVVVIGSGPAGYTAAIYTSRAFLKTLVLAGSVVGGQLTTTTEIENFPGFAKGIHGTQLVIEMKAQAERFGTEVVIETVQTIIKTKAGFKVKAGTQTYDARSIIIATGASPKTLGIPTEETFRGTGVSYCATCDGFFFRGKTVAVLGGGDTAMEEATFLTKFASHVTIIHRRDEFRASKFMLEKAKHDPKISFLVNKKVDAFFGNTVLQGLKLTDVVTGKPEKLLVDGAFVAIGHTPATGFLKGIVELDEKGYVILPHTGATDARSQTTIPGIFAAGDCIDPRYRQAIIAAGTGAMAGIDAERWLSH